MASVDDKIIRMQFDNAQFERNLQQTLSSLQNLEKMLKMAGAKKGLEDINTTAKSINVNPLSQSISGIGTAVSGISSKFSAFGLMAVGALTRIGSSAVAAGASMLKSFTFEPITAGFGEYETKIGSIQTMLANTARYGTKLPEVNAILDELNTYADKTIYSFGDMTKNIGLFTNAGLRVKDASAMIQGFSNVAAASGTSAEGAANAAYQLSQALSTGQVRLMDWRSLTNVGMGNKNMQDSIIGIANAMGTLKKSGIDAKTVQKDFNGSLEKGWLTADVMSNYLKIMAGKMTDAQMATLGLNKTQIAGLKAEAKTAEEAATKVRTLTQLFGTVKEAIGSGWAETFQLIFGNFETATTLFTNINNVVSGFVGKMSDARNNLLKGWDKVGGRTLLIYGLTVAIRNLGKVMETIKSAFREIFPAVTTKQLVNLTVSFFKLMVALRPTADQLKTIHTIFKGFFAALSIGWTILKEGIKFIFNIGKALLGLAGPGLVAGLTKISEFFIKLQSALVKGKGIEQFFAGLTAAVQTPIKWLQQLRDKIVGLFTGFDNTAMNAFGKATERASNRFQNFKDLLSSAGPLGRVFEPIVTAAQKVGEVLKKVWDVVANWFKGLGRKLAEEISGGEFNNLLDALNVALVGGIALILRNFAKNGSLFKNMFNFDVGSGMFDKVGKMMDQLTGTLKAMQAQIKAETLKKIATSIAILTASVLVLSMIDSDKLTKALTAMAIGFGQLMASFAVLTKMAQGPKSAASFGIISVGLTALATSILILSVAMKVLGTMDWAQIAKGLVGVSGGLTAMVVAVRLLEGPAKGLIRASLGITALSLALIPLSIAMKIIGTMSWEQIAKGLVGVAGGLLAISLAMKLMPAKGIISGLGFVEVAFGLNLLAGSMKLFGMLKWEEIAKGIVAIAGGLVVIGLAMQLMPISLPITAAGLILVGIALGEIAGVMAIFGKMEWGTIGKGLAAMGGALVVLAVGVTAMGLSLPGAIALGVVAASLTLLLPAIMAFQKMNWDDLNHGLLIMAAALGSIAIISVGLSGATSAMFALGIALMALGGGFALFGLGVMLISKGVEVLAKAGEAGAKALEGMLKAVGKSLGALGRGVAEGIVEMAITLAKGAPVLAKALGVTLIYVLDTIIKLIPKMTEVMTKLIGAGIQIFRDKTPDMIIAGFEFLINFLKGIRDNIEEITVLVADIVIKFIDAFKGKIPELAAAIADSMITMWQNVSYQLGRVAATLLVTLGMNFIQGFMDGLNQSAPGVMSWFQAFPGKILGWIGSVISTLWQKGVDFIRGIINGYNSMVGTVSGWFTSLPGKIVGWVGNALGALRQKGVDILQGLINGYTSMIGTISGWFASLPGKIPGWIGGVLGALHQKGVDILTGLLNGAVSGIGAVTTFISTIPQKITGQIPNPFDVLYSVGKDIIAGLWNGLVGMKDWLIDRLKELASWIPEPIRKILRLSSPSRVFWEIGKNIVWGLGLGVDDNTRLVKKAMTNLSNTVTDNFKPDTEKIKNTFNEIVSHLQDLDAFHPTITPVLDLSQAATDAEKINAFWKQPFIASKSFATANTIAKQKVDVTPDIAKLINMALAKPNSPKFEQNIYAPKQLSTADIYRQTRNQITLAKEMWNI